MATTRRRAGPPRARPRADGAAHVRHGPRAALHAGLRRSCPTSGSSTPSSRWTTQAAGRAPGRRIGDRRPSRFPPVKLLLTPYREVAAGDIAGRFASACPRAPGARRGAPSATAGAAPARRLQPVHGRRHAVLRGSDPRRAADDRVVASPHAGLDGRRRPGQDLAALAGAGDQGPGAPARPCPGEEKVKRRLRVRSDLLWMIRVVGALTIVRQRGPAAAGLHGDGGGRRGGDGGRLASWSWPWPT